jgi:hypothetical protein
MLPGPSGLSRSKKKHRWFEDVKNNLPAREASEFMALLNLVGSIDRI